MTDLPGAGLRLVIDGERATAALWRNHRENPTTSSRLALFEAYRDFALRMGEKEWRRVGNMAIERTECAQLAIEALLQSIDRFDPTRDTPFEAYVRPRVKGNLHNALAKSSEANSQYAYRRRVDRDRLRSLKGAAQANDSDILGRLSAITTQLALGFMLETVSGEALGDIADAAPSAFDSLAFRQMLGELDRRLVQLPQREAFVLAQHYRKGLQFQQIASLMGVSKGRVSQLHAQGLARLRKQMSRLG